MPVISVTTPTSTFSSSSIKAPTLDEVKSWLPALAADLKDHRLCELNGREYGADSEAGDWVPWLDYDKGEAWWSKTAYATAFEVEDNELWFNVISVDGDGDWECSDSVQLTNNPNADNEFADLHDECFNLIKIAEAIYRYDQDVANTGTDPLGLYLVKTREELIVYATRAVKQYEKDSLRR